MQNTKKLLASIWEIAEVVIIAGASILIIYGFIAQPFVVEGTSMVPNFQDKNYLIVDELTYRLRAPERGEVIVFRAPPEPSKYYIKRIVGLPGETVTIKGDVVTVNGSVLDEKYLSAADLKFSNDLTYALKSDEYFVMGDNRPVSSDSRSWGPLKKSYIVGMVRLRFWPPSEFNFYNEGGQL